MDINIAEVVAQVTDAFMRYERALCANELDTIDKLFWDAKLSTGRRDEKTPVLDENGWVTQLNKHIKELEYKGGLRLTRWLAQGLSTKGWHHKGLKDMKSTRFHAAMGEFRLGLFKEVPVDKLIAELEAKVFANCKSESDEGRCERFRMSRNHCCSPAVNYCHKHLYQPRGQ